jgi:hypothetical protein
MRPTATSVSAFNVEHVESIPKDLRPGVLYVSKRFRTAAHLCPCGCGSKVRTPLLTTAWSLSETERGASLVPSIGNWQKPCRSHYFIKEGRVIWANAWTPEEIAAGRRAEDQRRNTYYAALERGRVTRVRRFLQWIASLFGR